MDYLKQILLESEKLEKPKKVKGPTGGQWENLLAYASSKKVIDPKHQEVWDKFPNYQKAAKEIIKVLNRKNLEKVKNAKKVSIAWQKYFTNIAKIKSKVGTVGKPNGTSKTDLMAGNEKFSLKKHGGSQLMSGFRAETLATLFAAFDMSVTKKSADYYKIFKEEIEAIALGMNGSPLDYSDGEDGFDSASAITDLLKELHDEYLISQGWKSHPTKQWRPKGIKYNSPEVRAQIKKTEGWKKLEKKIQGYILNSWKRRELHKIAQESFNKIFKKEEIWRNFLKEASSGEKKFGEDAIQCATTILEFNPDNPVDTTETLIDAWIETHINQIKVNVSFKTAGDKINDSCRLIVGKYQEEEEQMESVNNLSSTLSNIVNKLIYTEGVKGDGKKRNIYLKSMDSLMDKIYETYFNFQVQNESAMVIPSSHTGINFGNIAKEVAGKIFSVGNPGFSEVNSQVIGATHFAKVFPSIMQDFIIKIALPSFAKQYAYKLNKILKKEKISQKFFRILRLFHVINLEMNEDQLYTKIESDEFDFMFKKREDEEQKS